MFRRTMTLFLLLYENECMCNQGVWLLHMGHVSFVWDIFIAHAFISLHTPWLHMHSFSLHMHSLLLHVQCNEGLRVFIAHAFNPFHMHSLLHCIHLYTYIYIYIFEIYIYIYICIHCIHCTCIHCNTVIACRVQWKWMHVQWRCVQWICPIWMRHVPYEGVRSGDSFYLYV